MNKVYEFAIRIPELSKAEYPEVYSDIIKYLWDKDLKGSKKLSADSFKNVRDRIAPAFGFMAFSCDAERTFHNMCLAELIVLSHRKRFHKENNNDDRIKYLYDVTKRAEGFYPEIDEYMTADMAVSDDGWNV